MAECLLIDKCIKKVLWHDYRIFCTGSMPHSQNICCESEYPVKINSLKKTPKEWQAEEIQQKPMVGK